MPDKELKLVSFSFESAVTACALCGCFIFVSCLILCAGDASLEPPHMLSPHAPLHRTAARALVGSAVCALVGTECCVVKLRVNALDL